MNNIIEDLRISPLKETNYIKPLKVNFTLKAIKNEQELIGQQYNSGKISENTYNTLNKNLEKNRTELELKTTEHIS